jgi:hypothetical protein
MDTLRGTVSNLHTTTGGNPIATFTFDGTTIQISAALPPVIAEGDDVSVIGPRKSGILIAYAYRNHTQDAQGGARGRSILIYSSVFMLLTLLIGLAMQAWNNADTALIIGVMLAAGASYLALALRIRRAEHSLFAQPRDI